MCHNMSPFSQKVACEKGYKFFGHWKSSVRLSYSNISIFHTPFTFLNMGKFGIDLV